MPNILLFQLSKEWFYSLMVLYFSQFGAFSSRQYSVHISHDSKKATLSVRRSLESPSCITYVWASSDIKKRWKSMFFGRLYPGIFICFCNVRSCVLVFCRKSTFSSVSYRHLLDLVLGVDNVTIFTFWLISGSK